MQNNFVRHQAIFTSNLQVNARGARTILVSATCLQMRQRSQYLRRIIKICIERRAIGDAFSRFTQDAGTLLTSRKLEFGITWRSGRACDSCKRVIHMGERSAIGLAQIETRKSYCSFVYDLCDRVTRIVTGGYLSLACNCRINKNEKKGETREWVE